MKTAIRTIRHDDVSRVITEESKYIDLVILCSIRSRTAGGLAVIPIHFKNVTNNFKL
ncbi:hypothetical protein ACP6PL_13930 [Dapis sp. BLCC M126]|uniref:hypothetical protein n=1 Tax=Dapis sp. BLCC M126 TaxID=3400189 RepID=UPI003CE98E38